MKNERISSLLNVFTISTLILSLFSLQDALDIVSIGDEIVLSPFVYRGDGFHSLSFDPTTIFNISIISSGATINLDGYRFLTVSNNKSSLGGEMKQLISIEGLTFLNGNCEDDWKMGGQEEEGRGGALFISGNYFVSLKKCIFEGNECSVGSGSKGGAIYVSDGIIEIDECVFRNNSALSDGSEGGAISMERETVTITNSLFQKNNVGFYGAIRIITDTSVTIDNCTFLENSGDFEGNHPDAITGVVIHPHEDKGASVSIGNSVFIKNAITEYASGFVVLLGSEKVIVRNCTFLDQIFNILVDGKENIVEECSFSHNSGTLVTTSPVGVTIVSNCTFEENTVETKSLIFGSVFLQDSVFIHNEAASLIFRGPSVSIDNCKFEGNKFDEIVAGSASEVFISNVNISCASDRNTSLIFEGDDLKMTNVDICSLTLKSGTLSIQIHCFVDDLLLEGGDVSLEGGGSSLEVEGEFKWKSGKIQSKYDGNTVRCGKMGGMCKVYFDDVGIGDKVVFEMFGEKEMLPGRSSNYLRVDGTLILFDSTNLFDKAQIGGVGTLVLEEGSILDLKGVSGVFISPSLEMRDNASLMLEVDDRDRFTLNLHQQQELNAERNISRGKMVLSSSEGSRFEEGGVYTIASTSQKMTPFSSVEWQRHQFEVQYNSSGVYVVFQGIEWDEKWIGFDSAFFIMIMILNGCGFIATICFLIFTIKNWNGKVIKAATPPLLVFILAGIGMAFVGSPFWVAKPDRMVCELRVWLPFVGLILILGPLATKTWRLQKLFIESGKTFDRVVVTASQLIPVVIVEIAIEIVILIVWTVLSPNDVGYDPIKTDDGNPQRAELYCSTSSPILLPLLMIYNGIICGAASYLAFRSRTTPSLFNESRWIAFSLYNLFLWGAMLIVLGYSLSGDVLIYQSIMSFGIFFVSYLILCLLFIPKVWMMRRIKTKPGKDIRKMTTGFGGLSKSSIVNQTSVTTTPQNNASINGQQKIDKLEKENKKLRERNQELAEEKEKYAKKYKKVKKRLKKYEGSEEESISPSKQHQELDDESDISSEDKAEIETIEEEEPVLM